jgi:hypothetical protein
LSEALEPPEQIGSRKRRRTVNGRGAALPFYFVNVVWGAGYVSLFVKYSIPTLLSARNLPSLPNREISEFLIVTTSEDAELIRNSKIFPLLSRNIKVVFLPITITAEHKYDLMTQGHKTAIEYVARRGYCIFLSPDALVSDGTLQRLFELVVGGRRVIAGFGPRVDEEPFLAELHKLRHYRDGEPLSLAPRQLVEVTMRHLHSDTKHHFVDCPYFPEKPYACLWPGPGGDGMLVRSLSLHPYVFDCRLIAEGDNIANLTIDWYLIPRFVTDWNDFYVEKDSDQFCIVGTTPAGLKAKPRKRNRPDAEALSVWLLRNRYALVNRTSFLYPIVFHSRPLNEEWEALKRHTGEFALEVADPSRAARDFTLFGHAVSRQSWKTKVKRPPGSWNMNYSSEGPPGKTSAAVEETLSGLEREPIPFVYGFSVWGEQYIDYLCRFALPSMLSPRNIPALVNNDVSSILIATTPEDEKKIRSHDVFRLLTHFINVEFLYLLFADDKLPTVADRDKKYHLLSLGHSMAADRAAGRGCAIFLAPDAIYSDGMFSRLYELALSGKEAVVGMGPRVNEETIVPELTSRGLLEEGKPLVVQSRAAVDLLLRHLHEDARLLRWSSPLFPQVPYMCVWDVGGGDGILLRCLTLHPYLLDYRNIVGYRARPHETSAVDASFLTDTLIPWNKIHQVTDSDDFIVLSLTSMHQRDYRGEINSNPLSALVNSSQRDDVTMLHRNFFMNAIKMHSGDLDTRWSQLERETLRIAYNILSTSSLQFASVQALIEKRVAELVSVKANELAVKANELVVTRANELAVTRANELAVRANELAVTRANELVVTRINELLAGDLDGISGRMAMRLVLKKLGRRLRRGRR